MNGRSCAIIPGLMFQVTYLYFRPCPTRVLSEVLIHGRYIENNRLRV